MTRSRDILYGVVAALIAALAVGICRDPRIEAIQLELLLIGAIRLDGITEVGNPYSTPCYRHRTADFVLYPIIERITNKERVGRASDTRSCTDSSCSIEPMPPQIIRRVKASRRCTNSAQAPDGGQVPSSRWLRFGGLNPAIHATAVASALIGVLAFGKP